MTAPEPLRIGVVGLGRAFTLMLPTFRADPRVRLVAATDLHSAARQQFEQDFSAPTDDSIEALCQRTEVQVVYIATPHQMHARHVAIAAAAGKHVLVEKPMAVTLADCTAMIDCARAANVRLIVGHSHSFDAPIQRTKALIDSGAFGAVRMITAINYTDFLYRPRRPEELDAQAGGGVGHTQAAHQIDITRLLGGGLVQDVTAQTGRWDPTRPIDGAYSAMLRFASGAFATLVYSGHAHFDSDQWMDGIGELGHAKPAQAYGTARLRLQTVRSAGSEAALKAQRNYGGALYSGFTPGTAHQHFGPLIVSCDHADLRPMPSGVWIHADGEQRFEPLPAPTVARREVIDELCAAVWEGVAPLHSGEWARATTEVCLGLLASAASGERVGMGLQVVARGTGTRGCSP